MSLSDLDLCKKIADIEGLTSHIAMEGSPNAYIWCDDTETEYDPLTNKALLFDLMYKYDVSTCRYSDCAFIVSDYTDIPHKASVSFSGKEEFSRAILECIVEANKDGQ